MTKEDLRNLLIAGKIARIAREKVCAQVKKGVKIAALYEYAKKIITAKEGVQLAFPPNISIGECAAHDTAGIGDSRLVPDDCYVKIDLGANVGGMLSDTAKTVAIGSVSSQLMRASEDALQAAIETIRPGLNVRQVGKAVQETIEGYGFRPISNLTGHQIKKGTLHAGLSIPNIYSRLARGGKIKKGQILAVEPFATVGEQGYVQDQGLPLIFSIKRSPKSILSRQIYEEYRQLPFAARDIRRWLPANASYQKIVELLHREGFHSYAPLIEISHGQVSQHEHTILVQKKENIVLTK